MTEKGPGGAFFRMPVGCFSKLVIDTAEKREHFDRAAGKDQVEAGADVKGHVFGNGGLKTRTDHDSQIAAGTITREHVEAGACNSVQG